MAAGKAFLIGLITFSLFTAVVLILVGSMAGYNGPNVKLILGGVGAAVFGILVGIGWFIAHKKGDAISGAFGKAAGKVKDGADAVATAAKSAKDKLKNKLQDAKDASARKALKKRQFKNVVEGIVRGDKMALEIRDRMDEGQRQVIDKAVALFKLDNKSKLSQIAKAEPKEWTEEEKEQAEEAVRQEAEDVWDNWEAAENDYRRGHDDDDL